MLLISKMNIRNGCPLVKLKAFKMRGLTKILSHVPFFPVPWAVWLIATEMCGPGRAWCQVASGVVSRPIPSLGESLLAQGHPSWGSPDPVTVPGGDKAPVVLTQCKMALMGNIQSRLNIGLVEASWDVHYCSTFHSAQSRFLPHLFKNFILSFTQLKFF